MIGFFEPRLPRVFIAFLGAGLALRRVASAVSNLSFSTFIVSSWYYGGCGGIQTPGRAVTRHTDYKSGPINLSGTHPPDRFNKESGLVASRILTGERRTTTRIAILCKGISQRFASFSLNSRPGVSAPYPPRARRSIFSCISRLTFWEKIKQFLLYRAWDIRPLSTEDCFFVEAVNRCMNISHAIVKTTKIGPALHQFLKKWSASDFFRRIFLKNIQNEIVQFSRTNRVAARGLFRQNCEVFYDICENRNFPVVVSDLSIPLFLFAT